MSVYVEVNDGMTEKTEVTESNMETRIFKNSDEAFEAYLQQA